MHRAISGDLQNEEELERVMEEEGIYQVRKIVCKSHSFFNLIPICELMLMSVCPASTRPLWKPGAFILQ